MLKLYCFCISSYVVQNKKSPRLRWGHNIFFRNNKKSDESGRIVAVKCSSYSSYNFISHKENKVPPMVTDGKSPVRERGRGKWGKLKWKPPCAWAGIIINKLIINKDITSNLIGSISVVCGIAQCGGLVIVCGPFYLAHCVISWATSSFPMKIFQNVCYEIRKIS